jgi:hypothetical protein
VTTIQESSLMQEQLIGTKCKRGLSSYYYTGTVTADTGPGNFQPGSGPDDHTTVSADVCVDSSGNFKLARGSAVVFYNPF